jgi:tetratricopeptide (TPR) repeat protein
LFASSLLSSAAAQTQDSLLERYRAAQTFLLAGDVQSAERAFEEAAAAALERLGNLAARQGQLDEALALVDEAIAMMPSRADAHVSRGAILFRRREFDKAIGAAERALQLDPQQRQAAQLLGKLYFIAGRLEEALPHLEEALARDPTFDVAYALAISYVRLKRLVEARRLFRNLVVAQDAPRLHILIGRVYREAGLYEQAIGEFKRALELNPREPRAHFLIGLTELLQGGAARFAEARAHFEAEIAVTPDDYASHFLLGTIHLSERRWHAAEISLEKAHSLQSANPDPMLYLGQLYFQTGRYEQAASALKKAIALTTDISRNNHQVARAHYLLAQALGRLGRHEEALVELKRSEELRLVAFRQQQAEGPLSQARAVPERDAPEGLLFVDDSSAALSPEVARSIRTMLAEVLGQSSYNLGVISARRERYKEAFVWFQRAARWKPDLMALDRSLGLAAFRAERYAEAVAPLERHLVAHPDDAVARRALGMSYFMQDRFADALRAWRSWLEALPDDPALLYALGVSLLRTDQAARAAQIFSRLADRYGHVAEVHLILGHAYAHQTQYERARESFARALALNPALPEAHYSLGLVLLRRGELDEAAHHFREELRINPRHRQAKYHLAYVLQRAGRSDEALALLGELLGDEPTHADAHYLLGKMLLERGDLASAIAELEMAVQLAPDQDYSYYQLSLAYRRAGREEDAQRALRTYQRLKEKRRQPQ